jgi:hypothetical protein
LDKNRTLCIRVIVLLAVSAGLFPVLKNGKPDYCHYYQPEVNANGTCSNNSFTNIVQECAGDVDYAFDK